MRAREDAEGQTQVLGDEWGWGCGEGGGGGGALCKPAPWEGREKSSDELDQE